MRPVQSWYSPYLQRVLSSVNSPDVRAGLVVDARGADFDARGVAERVIGVEQVAVVAGVVLVDKVLPCPIVVVVAAAAAGLVPGRRGSVVVFLVR